MATLAITNEVSGPAVLEKTASRPVCARLMLEFSRNPVSGETFLAQSYQEPPLKVVRTFPQPDGAALAHLHNVSGGLLGGDNLTQKISLGSRASVQLTTTGATRVYRRRPGDAPTVQQTEICIGDDGLLEYLPDATIPFADARYRQSTSIQLSSGAGLFWWEILAPGREAGGELFAYEEIELKTRMSACGTLIAAENLSFKPAQKDVKSPVCLGSYRYLATFYICRAGLAPRAWSGAEEIMRRATADLTRPGEILWGVSCLVAHGLVVRCVARQGREVLPGLRAVWQQAKRHLYDQEAIPPRKVN